MAAGRRFLFALLTAFCLAGPAAAGNQLAAEASPYLQMHATDPVHWRAWSDASLAEAKRLGKPILLSIGYSACHWCHVMQRESFANRETAALINELFLPVLIDREERPDLDAQFQSTAVMLDLPTGWPLTVFLTPEAETYFSGTYYPGEARQGMPSFPDVLRRVHDAFRQDPEGVRQNAALIKTTLARVHRPRPSEVTATHRALAAAAFLDEADSLAGGFGDAAKFPQWVALSFLWRHHLRTGSQAAGEHVRLSLRQMVRGGVYDHVGDGFFRYTVDPLWRVPHFEKMLDVNAGLLRLMAQVWRETRDEELARAVTGTVEFLERDMRLAGGAFAASLDADSRTAAGEEEEGAFYRWRSEEVAAALGPAAKAFLDAYAVAPLEAPPGSTEADPEWGTLYRQGTTARPAALITLRGLRARRHPPYRDGKVLADWNGLAIAALAEAGAAFGKPAWTAAAERAFASARDSLTDTAGRLHQSAVGDRRGAPATLAGLATLADAAVSLFEVTGKTAYLDLAQAWAEAIGTHHGDARAGGFFDSAADAGGLTLRLKTIIDDPNPSGNARAAELAARLYFHTGETRWRQMAETTIRAHGLAVAHPSLGIAGLLNAADTLDSALQVVIIGDRGRPDTRALVAGVMARSLPAQVLQIVPPGTVLPVGHPARLKEQIDGQATVYVCRGTICSLPATDRKELDATLVEMRRS